MKKLKDLYEEISSNSFNIGDKFKVVKTIKFVSNARNFPQKGDTLFIKDFSDAYKPLTTSKTILYHISNGRNDYFIFEDNLEKALSQNKIIKI